MFVDYNNAQDWWKLIDEFFADKKKEKSPSVVVRLLKKIFASRSQRCESEKKIEKIDKKMELQLQFELELELIWAEEKRTEMLLIDFDLADLFSFSFSSKK